jgi:ABC-2 type transport system ATP-binding protein
MDSGAALEISGLSHAFGKVVALKDIDLTVPRGTFVALLGVNGAGKTTLFSLITRLYDNTSGVIRVMGHDLRRSPGKALARLGVVFQTRALDSDLTVQQNLTYHAALHGIDRAAARVRIAEVLAQVDLADKAAVKVAALSGGQQRRAEIARALINRPDLLLLDEATTGLDVKSRREVLALVRGLVAGGQVSVLWATHILDEIAPEDQVYVLHRGAVLTHGVARDIAGDKGLTQAFLALTGAEA